MIDLRLEDTVQGPVLMLSGDLTIENAETLKTALVDRNGVADAITFDLSGVTGIDAAGFQVLWSALKAAGRLGEAGAFFATLPEDLNQVLWDAGYAAGMGASANRDRRGF